MKVGLLFCDSPCSRKDGVHSYLDAILNVQLSMFSGLSVLNMSLVQ